MTGVHLTDFAPGQCPRGHYLGPHKVLIGWHPCDCPAAQKQPGAHGHIRVRCTACLDERIDTSFYDPPCSLSGETDGRPDVPDGTGTVRGGRSCGG